MLRPGHSANFWKGLSSKHLATFCRDIGGICKGVQLVLHIQQLLLQITESDGIPGHEVKGMILNLIPGLRLGDILPAMPGFALTLGVPGELDIAQRSWRFRTFYRLLHGSSAHSGLKSATKWEAKGLLISLTISDDTR